MGNQGVLNIPGISVLFPRVQPVVFLIMARCTPESLKTAFSDQSDSAGSPSLPLSTGRGELPLLGPFGVPHLGFVQFNEGKHGTCVEMTLWLLNCLLVSTRGVLKESSSPSGPGTSILDACVINMVLQYKCETGICYSKTGRIQKRVSLMLQYSTIGAMLYSSRTQDKFSENRLCLGGLHSAFLTSAHHLSHEPAQFPKLILAADLVDHLWVKRHNRLRQR